MEIYTTIESNRIESNKLQQSAHIHTISIPRIDGFLGCSDHPTIKRSAAACMHACVRAWKGIGSIPRWFSGRYPIDPWL
jgi:hypothetical protein